MIEFRCLLGEEISNDVEDLLPETGSLHWSVHHDLTSHSVMLRGFFENEDDGRRDWEALRTALPMLPEALEIVVIDDQDWKEAYKAFFKPWSLPGLHWVPEWMRGKHRVPNGEAVVYLDPGMAFGTGNHETTRFCAGRILEAREFWAEDYRHKTVIDAGCGSGILALSAAALGFSNVVGFDNDPEAVCIACENAKRNGLEAVRFFHSGLEDGLSRGAADVLLVNIFANVLRDHAELLLTSVRDGGMLALSGILRTEADLTASHFAQTAAQLGILWNGDTKTEGEWADVRGWVNRD